MSYSKKKYNKVLKDLFAALKAKNDAKLAMKEALAKKDEDAHKAAFGQVGRYSSEARKITKLKNLYRACA